MVNCAIGGGSSGGGGGSGGTTYTAGSGISIVNDVISVTGGGIVYNRPALSAFTAGGSQSGAVATDITNGPIVVKHPYSASPTLANWQYPLTGSPTEFMLTAQLSVREIASDFYQGYSVFGVGVTDGTHFWTVDLQPSNKELNFNIWGSAGSASAFASLTADTYNGIIPIWIRIYYQASDTATPYSIFLSPDGFIWDLLTKWDGVTDEPGSIPVGAPTAVLFDSINSGNSNTIRGGSILDFIVTIGTGSSLTPYDTPAAALGGASGNISLSAGNAISINNGTISANYAAGSNIQVSGNDISFNPSGLPVPFCIYSPGTLTASQILWSAKFPYAIGAPNALTNWEMSSITGTATASTALTLTAGGTAVAEFAFSAGGSIATPSAVGTAALAISANTRMQLVGPASPDATLSGIEALMLFTRS